MMNIKYRDMPEQAVWPQSRHSVQCLIRVYIICHSPAVFHTHQQEAYKDIIKFQDKYGKEMCSTHQRLHNSHTYDCSLRNMPIQI